MEGGLSERRSGKLKAHGELFAVVVFSVSWYRPHMSGVKCCRVGPLHPNSTRLLPVVSTLPTQQLARRPTVPHINKYDAKRVLICFKSLLFIAMIRAESSRAAQGQMILHHDVLIHHVHADLKA